MSETSTVNIKELNERIRLESSFVDIINMEMNKVIVGQKHLVEKEKNKKTSCSNHHLAHPVR